MNLLNHESPYRVDCVHDRDLLGLQAGWTALLDAIPDASVFQTWEWANAASRYLPTDQVPWLLLAHAADGRLAGIAPWALSSQHFGPLRARRVSFLSDRVAYAPHQNIIAAPGERLAVAGAFGRHLAGHTRSWDILDLRHLAADSALRVSLAAVSGRPTGQSDEAAPFIRLPASWEVFEKNLGQAHRKHLRQGRNRLDRDYPGRVRFRRVATSGDLPRALDVLIDLSKARWHSLGLTSAFDRRAFAEFQREFATVALDRDWLRFYLLEVDGVAIAAELAFCNRKTFHSYQGAFAAGWARYSPGQLLLAHAIQQAIAESVAEYDLLTGDQDYKLAWTSDRRLDTRFLLSGSAFGELCLVGAGTRQLASAAARRLLPPLVQVRLQQAMARRS